MLAQWNILLWASSCKQNIVSLHHTISKLCADSTVDFLCLLTKRAVACHKQHVCIDMVCLPRASALCILCSQVARPASRPGPGQARPSRQARPGQAGQAASTQARRPAGTQAGTQARRQAGRQAWQASTYKENARSIVKYYPHFLNAYVFLMYIYPIEQINSFKIVFKI